MVTKKRWQLLLFLLITFGEFMALEGFLEKAGTDYTASLMLRNIWIILMVNGTLLALFRRMKPAMFISCIGIFLLGVANYIVIQARGYGIVYGDIYALQTAMNVAGGYSFHLDIYFFVGVIYILLCIGGCLCFPKKKEAYWSKKNNLFAIGLIGIICVFGFWMNTSATFWDGVSSLYWDHKIGMDKNGYLLYVLANAEEEEVTAPEGYSYQKAEKILKRYMLDAKEGGDKGNSSQIKPNIIVIMSEAFGDLTVLGDVKTNRDPLRFYHSLKENALTGYALSSVYGGYTAVSEFEFLSGCTKAFLPGNPYLQYISGEIPALANGLKAGAGYQRVYGMHPYKGSGYNRNHIYPWLGFDQFYTEKEFKNPDTLRKYISDECNFEKIISLYEKEKKKSEQQSESSTSGKLCLFNVTMQNHSPYDMKWKNTNAVRISAGYIDPVVNQYLSLQEQSDKALESLIAYFSRTKDPTIILLFGDHQPKLPDMFYKSVMGKMPVEFGEEESVKEHLIPFLIWKNYDLEKKDKTLESQMQKKNAVGDADSQVCTSINYLSTMLLENAGLDLSPYHRFLKDVQKQIPAISGDFYRDSEGNYHEITQASDKEEQVLKEYEIVQYYYLFDKKHRDDALITGK